MAPGSAYDEEPAAIDKIDHWFDLSSRDDRTEPHQSITLIGVRAQLQRLVEQRDWLLCDLAAIRTDHQNACVTIAQMHKADVGETRSPIRGVVEDVQDLRTRCLAAEETARRALNADMASLSASRQQRDEPGSGSSQCTAEVSDNTCTCVTDPKLTDADA